ncbi:hypothetical protein ACFO3O_19920 [Dokdonia ponticola]|uniref:SH3 domain-containing protein n=1 Tax=Dokdonia ponticola TaxID=2041041 RepID=A0ABV9I4I6_9FLAO
MTNIKLILLGFCFSLSFLSCKTETTVKEKKKANVLLNESVFFGSEYLVAGLLQMKNNTHVITSYNGLFLLDQPGFNNDSYLGTLHWLEGVTVIALDTKDPRWTKVSSRLGEGYVYTEFLKEFDDVNQEVVLLAKNAEFAKIDSLQNFQTLSEPSKLLSNKIKAKQYPMLFDNDYEEYKNELLFSLEESELKLAYYLVSKKQLSSQITGITIARYKHEHTGDNIYDIGQDFYMLLLNANKFMGVVVLSGKNNGDMEYTSIESWMLDIDRDGTPEIIQSFCDVSVYEDEIFNEILVRGDSVALSEKDHLILKLKNDTIFKYSIEDFPEFDFNTLKPQYCPLIK